MLPKATPALAQAKKNSPKSTGSFRWCSNCSSVPSAVPVAAAGVPVGRRLFQLAVLRVLQLVSLVRVLPRRALPAGRAR